MEPGVGGAKGREKGTEEGGGGGHEAQGGDGRSGERAATPEVERGGVGIGGGGGEADDWGDVGGRWHLRWSDENDEGGGDGAMRMMVLGLMIAGKDVCAGGLELMGSCYIIINGNVNIHLLISFR